jgi:hypothetical protein
MKFVPHRKHTRGPPGPVMVIALLAFSFTLWGMCTLIFRQINKCLIVVCKYILFPTILSYSESCNIPLWESPVFNCICGSLSRCPTVGWYHCPRTTCGWIGCIARLVGLTTIVVKNGVLEIEFDKKWIVECGSCRWFCWHDLLLI